MNKNVGAEHDMFGFIDESERARATTGREHYLPPLKRAINMKKFD